MFAFIELYTSFSSPRTRNNFGSFPHDGQLSIATRFQLDSQWMSRNAQSCSTSNLLAFALARASPDSDECSAAFRRSFRIRVRCDRNSASARRSQKSSSNIAFAALPRSSETEWLLPSPQSRVRKPVSEYALALRRSHTPETYNSGEPAPNTQRIIGAASRRLNAAVADSN
jgi:hypothetical protein